LLNCARPHGGTLYNVSAQSFRLYVVTCCRQLSIAAPCLHCEHYKQRDVFCCCHCRLIRFQEAHISDDPDRRLQYVAQSWWSYVIGVPVALLGDCSLQGTRGSGCQKPASHSRAPGSVRGHSKWDLWCRGCLVFCRHVLQK